jgi:hypothetical protein
MYTTGEDYFQNHAVVKTINLSTLKNKTLRWYTVLSVQTKCYTQFVKAYRMSESKDHCWLWRN